MWQGCWHLKIRTMAPNAPTALLESTQNCKSNMFVSISQFVVSSKRFIPVKVKYFPKPQSRKTGPLNRKPSKFLVVFLRAGQLVTFRENVFLISTKSPAKSFIRTSSWRPTWSLLLSSMPIRQSLPFFQLRVGVRHMRSVFKPGMRQARIRTTTVRLLIEPIDDYVSKWLKWHRLCFRSMSQQGGTRIHTNTHHLSWVSPDHEAISAFNPPLILCLGCFMWQQSAIRYITTSNTRRCAILRVDKSVRSRVHDAVKVTIPAPVWCSPVGPYIN